MENPWDMLDSMNSMTEQTIAHYEPKVEDRTAQRQAEQKLAEEQAEKKAIQDARNELLELEPVPIEKNQLMLDNILNQNA